jgi:hypothetical protein
MRRLSALPPNIKKPEKILIDTNTPAYLTPLNVAKSILTLTLGQMSKPFQPSLLSPGYVRSLPCVRLS